MTNSRPASIARACAARTHASVARGLTALPFGAVAPQAVDVVDGGALHLGRRVDERHRALPLEERVAR